jgi:hypothetical protein
MQIRLTYLSRCGKAMATLLVIAAIGMGGCKNTWSREDINSFHQACTDEARSWAGPAGANTYCECVFTKMSQKFPNESDALEHMDSLSKDTALINCRDLIRK